MLRKLTLGVQRHRTVLELVEWSVIVLIYAEEFLFESLKFVLVLWILADQLLQLDLKLR